jgi:hypothetical protein
MPVLKFVWAPAARAHAYLELVYEDRDGVQLVILALLIHVYSIFAGRGAGKERMARWQALTARLVGEVSVMLYQRQCIATVAVSRAKDEEAVSDNVSAEYHKHRW